MTDSTAYPPEPVLDIAHLGHLELLTPKFEESRKFFIDVMGMTQSGEKGDSIYLRGWDDYERYSLKLTASKTSGMAHVAFRTRSPQALERRAAALKGSGFDVGWTDGDLGHGKTFVCKDPDGHVVELYYDTEWYDPPPELKPALKNQAQRYPARGINVRRIDHFNGLATDIKANREFFEKYLGFRLTEQIVMDDGTEAGMWLTATNKSYDFAYTRDHTSTRGQFHHVTYALNSREDILRAADIFLENGIYTETGPHKHAVQQTFFLYVYEPGGNRVEVACAGARLVLAPDWKPIRWTEAERKKGQAWGLKTIESFHTHGTPPVEHEWSISHAAYADRRKPVTDLSKLTVGLIGTAEIVVGPEHTAPSVGSGAVHVLATPVMINLMEAAALACVEHLLPAGYESLGTHLNVGHYAATPVGMRLTATAEVTKLDGRLIEFRVEANDEAERVGDGTHTRVVVNVERFDKRVQAKLPKAK